MEMAFDIYISEVRVTLQKKMLCSKNFGANLFFLQKTETPLQFSLPSLVFPIRLVLAPQTVKAAVRCYHRRPASNGYKSFFLNRR
jgi:hypothetical protein